MLRLTAAEAGRVGESIRVEVNYATAQPESTFNLVVSREIIDASGEPTLVETEMLADLSMNPNAARFVQTVVAQASRLIGAAVQGTPPSFAGYSMSGRAEADWLAALNTLLATQANTGRFQISVDGGPSVPVLLNGPVAALGDIQAAINTALGALGGVTVATVAVPGGTEQALLILSNAADGQVRVQPGAGADIAGPMHLGTASGGLEVDGYAAGRPAPTGLFASLGDLDSNSGGWLNRLGGFLHANPADLPDIVVTTSQRTDSYLINGFTRQSFWEGLPGETRLRHAQGALEQISQQIASAVNASYRPSVQGFRLVLNPTFASFAEQESAVVSTGGSYEIGENPNDDGYLGRSPNVRRIPLGAAITPSNYVTAGDAGLDGDKPQLANYSAAFDRAAREIDIFNLLLLPRVLSDGSGNSQSDAERALLWGPASAFCRDERAFLLIDPPADPPTGWDDANSARNDIANLRIGVVGDHAMVSWPRLNIPDPATGLLKWWTRAGRSPGSRRASTARAACGRRRPASRPVLGVRGVEHRCPMPRTGSSIRRRSTRSGSSRTAIVIWGARTIDGFDNSGNDDYKYVPVRRLALFLEESLYRGLQFAVFRAERRAALGADPPRRRRVHEQPVPPRRVPGAEGRAMRTSSSATRRPRPRTTSTSASSTSSSASRR